MAVSPATFSCLLASAQQFRELAQVEESSEDVAVNSSTVRPLGPAARAAPAVRGDQDLARLQCGVGWGWGREG